MSNSTAVVRNNSPVAFNFNDLPTKKFHKGQAGETLFSIAAQYSKMHLANPTEETIALIADDFIAANPELCAKTPTGEWVDLSGEWVRIPERWQPAARFARNTAGELAAAQVGVEEIPSRKISTPKDTGALLVDNLTPDECPTDFPSGIDYAAIEANLRNALLEDEGSFSITPSRPQAVPSEPNYDEIVFQTKPEDIIIEPAVEEIADSRVNEASAEYPGVGTSGASYEDHVALGGRSVTLPAEWDHVLDPIPGESKPGKLARNTAGEAAALEFGRREAPKSPYLFDPAAVARAKSAPPERLVLPDELPAGASYADYVKGILNPNSTVTALADGTILTEKRDGSILIELPDGRLSFEIDNLGNISDPEELYAVKKAREEKSARPKPVVSASGTEVELTEGSFPFEFAPSGVFYLEKKETGDRYATFSMRDLSTGKAVGSYLIDFAGVRELAPGYYYLPEKVEAQTALAAITADQDTNSALADAQASSLNTEESRN